MMDQDQIYIQRCLALAQRGLGTASPNPLVGAVLVKNGRVIGEGHHEVYGQGHAEVKAFENCTEDPKGATLYCNLEPCSHTNKQTPPCVDLVISKKVARVVVSNVDPNPEVAGRGLEKLSQAGIEITSGVLQEEGAQLNEVFFKWVTQKMPFIHLKIATTLDGKMATTSGDSKWISDPWARTEVHEMRLKYDAVMIGRETLNLDDPELSIRLVSSKGKIGKKIVVGNPAYMNKDAKLFKDPENLICLQVEDYSSKEAWEKALQGLAAQKISSILVEGGPTLLSSLLKHQLYDRFTHYCCPLLLGEGRSFYQDRLDSIKQAQRLELESVQKVGAQVRMDFLGPRSNRR